MKGGLKFALIKLIFTYGFQNQLIVLKRIGKGKLFFEQKSLIAI